MVEKKDGQATIWNLETAAEMIEAILKGYTGKTASETVVEAIERVREEDGGRRKERKSEEASRILVFEETLM